jgi:hypothetical protein
MLKHKLLLVLLVLCLHSSAQNYVYQFEGILTEEQQKALIERINETKAFDEVKFQLKENKGQLFFTLIPEPKNKERDALYSVTYIKQLLIEFNLSPIQLIERQN